MSTEPLTFSELMQDGAWRISGLSLVLGLLLWGWFALTLSPIQRYYFSAYVGSSLHRTGSHEQDRAVWILKARPTNTFVVADPQDLVPAEHGPVPFALSKSAQAEGWTGTDVSPLNPPIQPVRNGCFSARITSATGVCWNCSHHRCSCLRFRLPCVSLCVFWKRPT